MNDIGEVGGGEAERHPATGRGLPASRRRRDCNSIHDMFLLAAEIASGDARRATLVSVDETRALAKLCLHACLVVNAASLLLQASDQGASKETLAEFMGLLADATRPFMASPPVHGGSTGEAGRGG